MTYALGECLQVAVYGRLSGDAELNTLISGAVFDAVPETTPDLFVALGAERAVGRSDATAGGAVHDFQVSVVTRRDGYLAAKAAAARVSDLLVGADIPLTRGRLISLRFLRADARRDKTAGTRRIDLRFRARLDDQGQ
ncbi:DUF3168 domain-containing protein [Jannaschia pohangensis]|uniref:Gene transfer agent protein n=1 Tax=Jannaschia pohangensis TaxID=390807 RepID=A0A1I3HS52_9RHOB|nr:DUF3168 domain-containing protein [Jannaschia pohangensis]SFI38555.1 Protein of unknown function [Jannaschia pohangensis]